MGAWATAIASNDTYADFYSEFIDLYNEGMDVPEITKKLIRENQDTINDTDDSSNFWFALAKAQWDYKQLEPSVLERVTTIIESGTDTTSWRELGASEKDIEKRKEALDKFLVTLQTEKPKAKPRKKTVITKPSFEKGDCLTLKLNNNNYGGVLVLEALDTNTGLNLIANTRLNQAEKPTLKDFEETEVLILNHGNWTNKPEIRWVFPLTQKTEKDIVIEKIGTLKIDKNYEYDAIANLTGSFSNFINQAEMQSESEKTKPKPETILSIKSLIKKKPWKLW